MQIYIHRNKQDFGPYSREAVLEYVKRGVFSPADHGCYMGTAQWKPLGELLGLAPEAKPRHAARPQQTGITPAPAAAPSSLPPRPIPAVEATPATPVRQVSVPAAAKKTGKLIPLNIFLLLCVIAGLYIRLGPDSVRQRLKSVASRELRQYLPPGLAHVFLDAQSPATALSGTSAPVSAPPPPPPVPEPTPTPPPKPFSPADLGDNSSTWPIKVILKQPVTFPAVLNGHPVGTVKVPAGAAVTLVNIQGDILTLEFQGGTQKLPWTLTNLDEVAHRGR
jgi:hypothetical protein